MESLEKKRWREAAGAGGMGRRIMGVMEEKRELPDLGSGDRPRGKENRREEGVGAAAARVWWQEERERAIK